MDYQEEYNDLSGWLSRYHRAIYVDYKMGRMEPIGLEFSENIKLEYRVIVKLGEDSFYADGAEVFLDEQGIQWVKFVPRNGFHRDKEHILRTDRVTIIRDNPSPIPNG